MRPFVPTALLACAALVAGCGGGTQAAPRSVAPAPPAVGGQLRLDPTGLHLGDATTGTSSGGVFVLPNSDVPPAQQVTREGVGAGASCPDVDLLPTAANMAKVQAATLCLLNGERADAGLGPLGDDTDLDKAAVDHNDDMIAAQYFDHIAPDGSDPVKRIQATGYIPKVGQWTVGENLAWGTAQLSTPKNIVKAWMNSAGHRANVLNGAYNDIGFGIAVGNPSAKDGAGATYTTTFGGKTVAAASKVKGTKKKRSGRQARIARKARAARIARASRKG